MTTQTDKDLRVKIVDRLFNAHASINRAIGYGIKQIVEGAPVTDEIEAICEQCTAIVAQAKIDCEAMLG